ncbi:MAG: FAD-dependent oxidoreductase, partial [Pseudomonadota bacterium]|nr:FAD-dependent oxidoreductase [Pseudomonadota bacterium]
MAQNVVVIGAGIVGASTALWLRRAGHTVTLLDKNTPGMGASFGNACLLASCAVVPNATPGLATKAPGYLLNPNFPLFLKWANLPRLTPWFLKYLSFANDNDARRFTHVLADLIGDSVEQHKALARGTAAESFIADTD